MRHWFTALFFLAFASTLYAAEGNNITEFTLKNGMEVVLIEDSRIPAISHNLLFRIGAADDPRGQSGLAHYLEHMLFQGTKTYRANEYSHLLAQKGGKNNAFTSADYTGYWVNIAKDEIELVMQLEADRLQHLSPKDADFAKEKQVIIEERRMRVDNDPTALFAEQMNALLYYHHPYGTPIIGWPQEMAALDKKIVLQYYREYYHPANAVLVLAGDFKTTAIKPLVERYYGKIPARKGKPAPRLIEPDQLGARAFTMRHPQVNQAEWQRSYLVPGYGWQADQHRAKILPLLLLEHILGGSQSSRLYRRLVEEEKLATSVVVSYNPFVMGPAEFTFYVTPVDKKTIPKITQKIDETLAQLKETPPSEAELTRAKTQLIASNIYLQDGLQPLARVMGHLKMLNMPLDYYQQWPEAIRSISAEDVQQSLSLLNDHYRVTGNLLPENNSAAKE
jgi:zinc protease